MQNEQFTKCTHKVTVHEHSAFYCLYNFSS
jgi:hypothetical protein